MRLFVSLVFSLFLLAGCHQPSVYADQEADFYSNLVPLLKEPSPLTAENIGGGNVNQAALWESVLGNVKDVAVKKVIRVRGRTRFFVGLLKKDGTVFHGQIVYVAAAGGAQDVYIYKDRSVEDKAKPASSE